MLEAWVTAAVFALAGFTMSFAGFGFAMVAVPLLALLMPMPQAVMLQFPICAAIFFFQAWLYRRHLDWGMLRPLVAGVLPGLAMGALWLPGMSEILLRRLLGGFVAAAALTNLTPLGVRLAARYAANPWWGRLCGLLSGIFLGAYAIGGPPTALYAVTATDQPLKAKALMAVFMGAQFAVMTVFYAVNGALFGEAAIRGLWFAPLAAGGAALGFWAFGRAAPGLYAKVVNLLLLVAAVLLWWRP